MFDALIQLDHAILFRILDLRQPLLDQVMVLISTLGNKAGIWIVISLILMVRKETRSLGSLTLLALGLGSVLGECILKEIFQRPRPYAVYSEALLLTPTSTPYSFPSGHTTWAFATAKVLTTYFKKAAPLIWVFSGFMAFSRVYLFMHFPLDILGGIFLGLGCGSLALKAYDLWQQRKGSAPMS